MPVGFDRVLAGWGSRRGPARTSSPPSGCTGTAPAGAGWPDGAVSRRRVPTGGTPGPRPPAGPAPRWAPSPGPSRGVRAKVNGPRGRVPHWGRWGWRNAVQVIDSGVVPMRASRGQQSRMPQGQPRTGAVSAGVRKWAGANSAVGRPACWVRRSSSSSRSWSSNWSASSGCHRARVASATRRRRSTPSTRTAHTGARGCSGAGWRRNSIVFTRASSAALAGPRQPFTAAGTAPPRRRRSPAGPGRAGVSSTE